MDEKTEETTKFEALKASVIREKADFRKLLALIIILGGGAYLWIEADADQVIAYVFGIMSVAIGYFFNTSKSSQDKTKQIQDLTLTKGGENV